MYPFLPPFLHLSPSHPPLLSSSPFPSYASLPLPPTFLSPFPCSLPPLLLPHLLYLSLLCNLFLINQLTFTSSFLPLSFPHLPIFNFSPILSLSLFVLYTRSAFVLTYPHLPTQPTLSPFPLTTNSVSLT